VFNYNTQEKVHTFEAHGDYIRCIAIHPSQPFVLSCSDDMQIKLWNWDKGWECTQVLEGHTHYVMCVVFNPKDTNTFASASLDQTIKVRAAALRSAPPPFRVSSRRASQHHATPRPSFSSAERSATKVVPIAPFLTCVLPMLWTFPGLANRLSPAKLYAHRAHEGCQRGRLFPRRREAVRFPHLLASCHIY
jgi:hypothetical protein